MNMEQNLTERDVVSALLAAATRTVSKPLLFALLLLVLFAGGCATQPAQPQPSFFDEWKARAETSKPAMEPAKKTSSESLTPTDPNTATANPAEADTTGQDVIANLPTQSITVRFVNDELINVLRALGRMAGQNILISPNVKGSVNAHIENTPWNVVFAGLVNSYGLLLVQEPNLLRVMTLDDMKQQVEKDSLQKAKQAAAPLSTRFFPIEYANPEEILESVKPLLSKDNGGKERGSASVDKHSRSLIVNDTEADLKRIAELVERLDKSTPQILIEAHIVETNQDTARELGIQWGGIYRESIDADQGWYITPGGINGKTDATTGQNTYEPGAIGSNRTGIRQQGFGVDLPAAAISNINPASIGFILENSKGNLLEIQLSALQKDGRVNILSQPSIITLDNNQAIIESGRDIPYQTIEDGSVKIEYKEASLKLTVTPHVINDTLVRLDIDAKKDEVDFNNSVAGNPSIIKKQAHTQLIVENGSTVVIAGLSKENKSGGDAGVPGLKDVPGLGWLFKKDSRSSTFEELLIFISPKILVKEQAAS